MFAIAGGILLALFILALFAGGGQVFSENKGCGCLILLVAAGLVAIIIL